MRDNEMTPEERWELSRGETMARLDEADRLLDREIGEVVHGPAPKSRTGPYWYLAPWVTLGAGVVLCGAVWYAVIWALMVVWPERWGR